MIRIRYPWKIIGWAALLAFVLLNVVCYIHAYKFTHFSNSSALRTKDPTALSAIEKFKTLLLGVSNPRPVHKSLPTLPYQSVTIHNQLGCWYLEAPQPKGRVILFHGYAGEKSSLLGRAYTFLRMGYSVLLVDFRGSGDSEGNTTSIGFHEATQVTWCYEYMVAHGDGDIYLFGTSMGAAAILKAVHDGTIQPRGIILECPFGSLYQTTCARFHNMHAPAFPFAAIMLFWGGIQNNFWAFGHNPIQYATGVTCPTLLFYGEQDDRVSRTEIDMIFENLRGEKVLKIRPSAGHNDLFNADWETDVDTFLQKPAPETIPPLGDQ